MDSSSSSSNSCTRSSLADDILIEIFAYLPLNSIYKLRCLSKVWLSNLSDPNFLNKWFRIHQKSLPWIQYHSIDDQADDGNPLQFSYAYHGLHSWFMSRNEHLFSFRFLINAKTWRLYLLASSNGLVLCYSFNKYLVCNPLTQTWVSLPSPPGSDYSPFNVHGIFCEYSSSLECCYKVVHIPKFDEPSKKINVDIFSSDCGAWQSFEVSCDESVVWRMWSEFNKVVILNGVLFWIDGRDRMLVYNLNQDNKCVGHRCSLINLPYVKYHHYTDSILGESEGRVCYARTTNSLTDNELTVSVWVLGEVNWQILYKHIRVEDILAEVRSRIGDPFATLQVLGFNPADRNVVLLGYKHWVWVFNIQTRSLEELCLDNTRGYVDRSRRMYLPFVLKPMPTVLPPPTWMET